ncbi:MAG TPA: beta-N-acetylhexosaminidase [Burkholderiaceae bacterium]|nr:beta-N-acetylhexosaminidase [Burkholderiaceae bacterium]
MTATAPASAAAPLGPVMLDIEGTVLNDADRRRLQHPNTGGVILFTRNFESREQLCRLTQDIAEARPGVLIAVDHEGGRVQRFRSDGFTTLPPMRRLGQLWDRDESAGRIAAIKAATEMGFILASELRACGIGLSFAPVLDLDWGRSKVIGDRAFHSDPRTVMLLAKSLMHGMQIAGMAACGKHFPAHGWAEADSHHALPVDDRSLEAILADDAAPYDWLGLSLPAVMPAHVVYPKVDAKPAGFSSIWLNDILRRRLGFAGAIFSDDLAMEGARAAGDVVSSAHAALDAGCDMVLICNSPSKADRLLDGLKRAPDAASAARIAALQPVGPALAWEALHASDRFAAAFKTLKKI